MLNSYISDVQQILHDTAAAWYPTDLITGWVNDARQHVAQDGECIRVLPPNSGGLASFSNLVGGNNYTNPTVTISAPNLVNGVQATASATWTPNGPITGLTVNTAGALYTIPPAVSITDPTGSGASAIAVLTPFVSTVVNQEVYNFSAFNSFVAQTPGVAAILYIKQIAVYWGNLKPALQYMPWTKFNAYYRSWPQFSNYPSIWSQYSQGANGSFYFWPIPFQILGMDLDCICSPIALASDTDPEAIPFPFQEAVKYRAAYRALVYAQRFDDAKEMLGLYTMTMQLGRASVGRSVVTRYYG